MDIHFERNTEDAQQARRLRGLLKQCYAHATDDADRSLITALVKQLETRLSDHGSDLRATTAPDDKSGAGSHSPLHTGLIKTLWEFIAGPSHREEELSKQRVEQVERAEHAEISAFEALAEAADLKKDLEEAQKKIHELETELGRRHKAG